jgi:hypothetical protein
MKISTLLILLFTVLTHQLVAQIDVIQTGVEFKEVAFYRVAGEKQIILRELIVKNDEDKGNFPRYQLTYKDFRYSRIYALQHFNIDNKESLMDMKKLIAEGFASSDNKYSVTFKMEDDVITIARTKSLGQDLIYLVVGGKGFSNQLTKRQWENFFQQVE